MYKIYIPVLFLQRPIPETTLETLHQPFDIYVCNTVWLMLKGRYQKK